MTKYIVPKGSQFLCNVSKPRLLEYYKKEVDSGVKARVLVCIKRKEGMTFRAIAATLNVPLTSVCNWLVRIHKGGIKRRYNIKRAGQPCRLSSAQITQLKADLVRPPQKFGFASTVWSTRMVAEHIKRQYGVTYAMRSVRDLLHRMGFSFRKPRPTSHKAASKQAQNQFKKKPTIPSDTTTSSDTLRCTWTNQSTD